MARRELTPEQVEKRDARRAKFREIAKTISELTEAQRETIASQMIGLATCEWYHEVIQCDQQSAITQLNVSKDCLVIVLGEEWAKPEIAGLVVTEKLSDGSEVFNLVIQQDDKTISLALTATNRGHAQRQAETIFNSLIKLTTNVTQQSLESNPF